MLAPGAMSLLNPSVTMQTQSFEMESIRGDWKSSHFRMVDNIPVFLPPDLQSHFETMYKDSPEPWDYTSRGVELLRFEYVVAKVKELNPNGGAMLDIGCALGQLTHRLLGISQDFYSMDISLTAVKKAKQNLSGLVGGGQVNFLCGSATELPFRDQFFDLVILSDGLNGWELNPEQKKAAISEAYRVLKPGGFALLTDYLHPRDFQGHVDVAKASPFVILKQDFLCDRLGFQLTTNLRAVKRWPLIRQMLGSVPFMRFLQKLSRPWGASASKHLALVLQRKIEQ